MEQVDVAVIGAGAVGLAIASEVAKAGNEVYVLEKHTTFGRETSDRNSETVHAGLYYVPGTLQGRLCVDGNRMIYEMAKKYNIPHGNPGKLSVAMDDGDMDSLEILKNNGEGNGAKGLKIIDRKKLKKMEPHIDAHAALWSPSSGIVSAHHLMKHYIAVAKEYSNGVEPMIYDSEVIGIDKIPEGYKITTKDSNGNEESIAAKVVVNSAGLNSDLVAEMTGIDLDKENYRLHFCKGEYFSVSHRHKGKINHLVYPIPGTAWGKQCIHPTVDLAGEMKLGPNAIHMKGHNIDYTVNEAHRQQFFDAVKKLMPFIELEDLQPDQAGIRPKLGAPGEPKRDFVIRDESDKGLPGLINLIGIESPGLTASPAIGKLVSDLVDIAL